jgi:integrase
MKNLNQLFNQTKVNQSNRYQLDSGKIILFKRKESSIWQSRFKLETGQWQNLSTGKEDIDEAKDQALQMYGLIKTKISLGHPLKEKLFKDVANETLAEMQEAKDKRIAKRTYRDYTIVINRYLNKFFGNTFINDIDHELIRDFESWRISEMGKIPKASTSRTHASAYNRVINLAKERGYIHANKIIPILKVEGAKSQSRPAFNQQEINQLLAYMETWELGSYTDQFNQNRRLMRCYVEFLLYTGIRHGTESIPIRWKHFQWHWMGEEKYLRVWVSGKTGPRYLIARRAVIESLERLYRWQRLPYDSLSDLLEAKLDRLVFITKSGYQPRDFRSLFYGLMRVSGLGKDTSGHLRTLYSLRHTYATFALSEGIDIHTLARQMGTSIAMLENHYSKITPMLSADKLSF